jgi:hypothetical protein
MSDEERIETARIIQALLLKDQEVLNEKFRLLTSEQVKNRPGSWFVRELHTLGKTHLEARAQIIFETLEQGLIGSAISSPNLRQSLMGAFITHFNPQMNLVSLMLQNATKDESYYKNMNFKDSHARLLSEYHARIDRLCRKLANETNKPHHGMSIGNQVNISGSSHTIQVGDHNIQQIVSSLTNLQALIDASHGTPDQKAEAKSQLQKFLRHPLVVSITGGIAGGLAKKILPDPHQP